MSKVSEFLTENSVQYLASVSLDGKAKCRPCMFSFEKDGKPCHQKTYDNEEIVRQMVAEQKDMKIPTELIPKCPVCGAPMTMNLRSDMTFVQDEGWYSASNRYDDFIRRHKDLHILFLELGVGANTPVIIKYPFWQMTAKNPKAQYA